MNKFYQFWKKYSLPIEYGIPLYKISNKRKQNKAKHCVGKLVSLSLFPVSIQIKVFLERLVFVCL